MSISYRRGNRFDAAQDWLERKDHYSPKDTSECQYCKAQALSKVVRGHSVTVSARRISRSTCQKGSLHFSEMYGIGSSQDVRSAAFVIQKLGRAAIVPYEREIERQLKIRARLKGKMIVRPTGVQLLRIVNQLIKLGVPNDSLSPMPAVRGEEASPEPAG